MTSYERMQVAMKHKKPDRVPVMCQLSFEFMEYNSGIRPFDMYFSADGMNESYLQLRRALAFDGIMVDTTFEDNWKDLYEQTKITKTPDGEHYALPDGREFAQKGCVFKQIKAQPEREKLDIEDADPEAVPLRLDYSNAMVLHKSIVEGGRKEQFSVHGEIYSPFDCLCTYLGLEGAMMALITHPEKCLRILMRYVDQCVAFAKIQIDIGVDAMKISSPFVGGSFISKKHYRDFVVPCESEVVRQIHAYQPDIPIYTHTCGFIGDRLELMMETGIDGLECMDPPPLGDTSLADAKARVGKKLFLKGNMDSVNVLLKADASMLEEYIKAMFRDGAQDGGYILSTACSVAPHVSLELLKHLTPLAEKYGCYDL